MSNVANSISNALARFGRTMTLRRSSLGPAQRQLNLDVDVVGVTRGYMATELVGNLKQGDVEVTISNKTISERQWPGPPVTGDTMIIDGRPRTIIAEPEPKYLGTDLIVWIIAVRG